MKLNFLTNISNVIEHIENTDNLGIYYLTSYMVSRRQYIMNYYSYLSHDIDTTHINELNSIWCVNTINQLVKYFE